MTDPTIASKRPLSPHLQVYRLPYNALMSISGRIAGIGLALTLIATLIWFIAVIFNPDLFTATQEFFSHTIVKYLSLAWAFVIFFYLGNGLRHVIWAIGVGVNEKAGIKTGNIVLIIAALLTFMLWNKTMNSDEVVIPQAAQSMEQAVEVINE